MGLESSVGLIVASLDLRLVRLVRAAMHPNNGSQGPGGPDRLIVPAPNVAPRQRPHAEPAVEPRPRVRPEPVFEPRAVLRPVNEASIGRGDVCVIVEVEKADATSGGSPIEPPWKVLPWENPPAPRFARPVQKVKVVNGRPDIISSGTLIDLFI